MKTLDELLVWLEETFGSTEISLERLYDIYREGYLDGYAQRPIDDEEEIPLF